MTDASPGEMNIIICRNVLIYFNKSLQNHVLNLFNNSLIPDGFLCLGGRESIMFSDIEYKFTDIDMEENIYQKKSEMRRFF